MEKTKRNSGHELLRIIAMYMIVFIHANMYLRKFCTDSSWMLFNGLVNGICNTGVTCFILISGYYGIKFNFSKLVKMECMMITYSLLETVVMYVVFPEQMQGAAFLEQLVKSCLPFVTRKYWFYSSYICLFLLSGYIQKFVECLKREEFKRLLIMLIVLFSIFPTLFYFELIPDNGKGLVQMILVYLTGRYIKMYRDCSIKDLTGRRKALLLFMMLWIVNGVSHEFPIQVAGIYHHLCKDNSITNIIMAVLLFYFFKDLKFTSEVINQLAKYIFAVFALNNTMVSAWMEIMLENGFDGSRGIPGFLMLAGIVLLILGVCLIIGVFREMVFGKADQRLASSRFLIPFNRS